ncbi:MAG: YbaK/EbsC family protein [Spirochaetaceae bacterium]
MIPEKVEHVLERHGLKALEFEPGSTPTAEAAARRIGVQVGQIAKSILLRTKDGGFHMAVVRGDRKLKNARVKVALGRKARMTTAEETEEATGFRPGGVCPFGVEDIPVYIDEGLAEYDTIYPAAGTDASGVPMSFEKLREVTGGTVAPLTADATSKKQ